MGKNWTFDDELILMSDIKDSINAGAGYFNSEPSYNDLKGGDFDEFCDSFFEEI